MLIVNSSYNVWQERDLRKKLLKDKIGVSAVQKLTLCKDELCVTSLELGPCLPLPPVPHHPRLNGIAAKGTANATTPSVCILLIWLYSFGHPSS